MLALALYSALASRPHEAAVWQQAHPHLSQKIGFRSLADVSQKTAGNVDLLTEVLPAEDLFVGFSTAVV